MKVGAGKWSTFSDARLFIMLAVRWNHSRQLHSFSTSKSGDSYKYNSNESRTHAGKRFFKLSHIFRNPRAAPYLRLSCRTQVARLWDAGVINIPFVQNNVHTTNYKSQTHDQLVEAGQKWYNNSYAWRLFKDSADQLQFANANENIFVVSEHVLLTHGTQGHSLWMRIPVITEFAFKFP